MIEDDESSWMPKVIATESEKLWDRPLEEVAGRDGPVAVLSDDEWRDICTTMMTLEHRVASLGDRRRLQRLVDESREGPVVGRMMVDMATDMIGLDAAARDIVTVLARRLARSDCDREKVNGALLAEALRGMTRDKTGLH